MTYLVERLAEPRRHLDRLRGLKPRVTARHSLERFFEIVCRLEGGGH